jgi:hypothetical protein
MAAWLATAGMVGAPGIFDTMREALPHIIDGYLISSDLKEDCA